MEVALETAEANAFDWEIITTQFQEASPNSDLYPCIKKSPRFRETRRHQETV